MEESIERDESEDSVISDTNDEFQQIKENEDFPEIEDNEYFPEIEENERIPDFLSEFDFSSDSSSKSETDEFEMTNSNDYLYSGSDIKTHEFALSFMILCKRININTKAKDVLLQFIDSILPQKNTTPQSYAKLMKYVKLNSIKKTNLCSICNQENCSCDDGESSNKTISVCEFDVESQVRSIVNKNFTTMSSYKGKKFKKFRTEF